MTTITGQDQEAVRTAVRERYGKIARTPVEEGQAGCCGPSCCGGESGDGASVSRSVGYGSELDGVPEGADLGLGCGNPVGLATLEPGQTVLDLGSGGGLDCFLAASAVGAGGHVIGVDMTPDMIRRARKNAAAGGHANVEFRLGEIEALPVADATVDVILSNCVLNLSPERHRVLSEALRVLRPGGRTVIADLVSDVAPPPELAGNLDAVSACLPTPREEYLGAFRNAGFTDVRVLQERSYPAELILGDPAVARAIETLPADTRAELETFAGSIRSIVLEARKG